MRIYSDLQKVENAFFQTGDLHQNLQIDRPNRIFSLLAVAGGQKVNHFQVNTLFEQGRATFVHTA